MNKVAVFGNAGGGKSTLSRQLAAMTGLPLYVIDVVQFRDGRYWPDRSDGGKIQNEEYVKLHRDILDTDRWIIDGFDSLVSAWERFAAADTLVYVDLPLATHYWRVTKRLAEGLLRTPEGWPTGSPVWSSSLNSYRVVWLCHRRVTPPYRQLVADMASSKRVFHVRSSADADALLSAARQQKLS